MNDKQLRTFITVADSNSFSQAEEVLFFSRQAIQKQVQSLEAELGFALFVRTTQGIKLTSAGEAFYEGVKKILFYGEKLIKDCRCLAQIQQKIRIGNPNQPRPILGDVFSEFAKRYPGVKQEIVFVKSAEKVQMVRDGTLDIAQHYSSDICENDGLECMKLCDLPYKCIIATNHVLASRKNITIEDLSGCMIGLWRKTTQTLISELTDPKHNIRIVEYEHNETKNIISFCYSGGIYISRAYFVNDLSPLVTIPLDCGITEECCLIYKKDHSSLVDDFISTAKSMFQGI